MRKTVLAIAVVAFTALGVGYAALTMVPTDAAACHPDCGDSEDRGSHTHDSPTAE